MVTTIEQVLHPFFIMCFIIGLDFYPRKQPRNRWIVKLSILYCLIIYFAYIYIFYHIMANILYNNSIFTIKETKIILVRSILMQINIFTSIMFAIMSCYHRKVKFPAYLYKALYRTRALVKSLVKWNDFSKELR